MNVKHFPQILAHDEKATTMPVLLIFVQHKHFFQAWSLPSPKGQWKTENNGGN